MFGNCMQRHTHTCLVEKGKYRHSETDTVRQACRKTNCRELTGNAELDRQAERDRHNKAYLEREQESRERRTRGRSKRKTVKDRHRQKRTD